MQKLVIGMTINRGFTLIELLIVIVIIGITVGFALIAFGDFGHSRRILFAAEQLANTLKLAQQQAILTNSTLGLRLDKSGYQILKYQQPSHWAPVSNKGIFKMTYFPKNTDLYLKTATQVSNAYPAIIINSSGDITPFTLSIGTQNDHWITMLTGHSNGSLSFSSGQTK